MSEHMEHDKDERGRNGEERGGEKGMIRSEI
jgi:hypothetical protein